VQPALHLKTTVLPGNKIEITAAELKVGETVEVFLVLPDRPGSVGPSALDVIKSLDGHRLFKSPEELDRHLQEERGSWDR
jgi:hypothetical protein